MAEAGGLNPLQHGFESHRGHCIGLPRSLALAMSNGSLRSLRCSPGSRRLRPIRRNAWVGESPLFLRRFIGFSCRSAAPPTSSSLGDERHIPSLLLSAPARDPVKVLDGNRWHSIRWFEAEDPAQEVDLRLGRRLNRVRSAKAMALTLEHDQ